ncbi:inositol-3-phosphate synthase [Microbacterium sp. NPDC019599]|uniref:inositol-3-phosphate synthase n=1 Tax=Microbacterium sp. NPDC019599 TaxID=3154690 RepID=UPI0033CDAFEB
MTNRIGAWLIGARGSLATTTTIGLHALARGIATPVGLTTATPAFASVPLAPFESIAIGGHDVVDISILEKAHGLAAGGMVPPALVSHLTDSLRESDRWIRRASNTGRTQQDDIDAMASDIEAFASKLGLSTVVVVDVSSTEPLPADQPAFHDEHLLRERLTTPGQRVLPPSSVAAAAAIQAGAAYAGFTPSAGMSLPVLQQRAADAAIPFAGQDGKTGETLLRTVLAPMFAARGLQVRSWAGANLLGGGDGATLADPEAVRSKLASKNRGLHALVGDDVIAPLHIDNVPDLGDIKVAWDHVNATGFLGSPITLQTTWSAYDSTLAAPLVIDLVRALALASQAGQSGAIAELGCFFKDPWGSDVHAFAEQTRLFQEWLERTGILVAARVDAEHASAAR